MATLCGGVGNSKPADAEIQGIVDKVKDQALAKTNQAFSCYEAVSYASQVVAGTNFFVKVKVGDGQYIHLRIFRPLPPNHENLELADVQLNKSEQDPISYF